jgi:hypothetical protein
VMTGGEHTITIPARELASGMYTLQIQRNGTTETQPFVVLR